MAAALTARQSRRPDVRRGRRASWRRPATARSAIIQRKLGVGYNKAAKLVERMEKEGVVGPASGKAGGRRDVLVRASERSLARASDLALARRSLALFLLVFSPSGAGACGGGLACWGWLALLSRPLVRRW